MSNSLETRDFNLRDNLLDYMFAQNSKLTDKPAGVSEELRLEREQADRHHKDLKSSLVRMEEQATFFPLPINMDLSVNKYKNLSIKFGLESIKF